MHLDIRQAAQLGTLLVEILSIFMPLSLHGKRGNWVSPVSVGVHFCVHIGNSLSGQKDLEKTWHSRMYVTWKTKVCSLKD